MTSRRCSPGERGGAGGEGGGGGGSGGGSGVCKSGSDGRGGKRADVEEGSVVVPGGRGGRLGAPTDEDTCVGGSGEARRGGGSGGSGGTATGTSGGRGESRGGGNGGSGDTTPGGSGGTGDTATGGTGGSGIYGWSWVARRSLGQKSKVHQASLLCSFLNLACHMRLVSLVSLVVSPVARAGNAEPSRVGSAMHAVRASQGYRSRPKIDRRNEPSAGRALLCSPRRAGRIGR